MPIKWRTACNELNKINAGVQGLRSVNSPIRSAGIGSVVTPADEKVIRVVKLSIGGKSGILKSTSIVLLNMFGYILSKLPSIASYRAFTVTGVINSAGNVKCRYTTKSFCSMGVVVVKNTVTLVAVGKKLWQCHCTAVRVIKQQRSSLLLRP